MRFTLATEPGQVGSSRAATRKRFCRAFSSSTQRRNSRLPIAGRAAPVAPSRSYAWARSDALLLNHLPALVVTRHPADAAYRDDGLSRHTPNSRRIETSHKAPLFRGGP